MSSLKPFYKPTICIRPDNELVVRRCMSETPPRGQQHYYGYEEDKALSDGDEVEPAFGRSYFYERSHDCINELAL